MKFDKTCFLNCVVSSCCPAAPPRRQGAQCGCLARSTFLTAPRATRARSGTLESGGLLPGLTVSYRALPARSPVTADRGSPQPFRGSLERAVVYKVPIAARSVEPSHLSAASRGAGQRSQSRAAVVAAPARSSACPDFRGLCAVGGAGRHRTVEQLCDGCSRMLIGVVL